MAGLRKAGWQEARLDLIPASAPTLRIGKRRQHNGEVSQLDELKLPEVWFPREIFRSDSDWRRISRSGKVGIETPG